jgi:hypothetical protein
MTADSPASFRVRHSTGANPIHWLILGGVFLIAAITIGTTIMAGNFRERALNSSKRELENTVLLLARSLRQATRGFHGHSEGRYQANPADRNYGARYFQGRNGYP